MRKKTGMILVIACLPACASGGLSASENNEQKTPVRFEIHRMRGGVNGPRCSRDGKLTVRVVRHFKAQIVDAQTGKPVGPVLEHIPGGRLPTMHISGWAFSPDGKLLATAAGNRHSRERERDTTGSVRVWEVATGKLLASNKRDIGRVHSVSFKDDKTVVIFCDDISGK